MGFWQGLARMVKGEPVYQQSDTPSDSTHVGAPQEPHIVDSQSIVPSQPSPVVDTYMKDGHKITPEVFCDHIEWHESGDHREIWTKFINRGTTSVFIDKISLLGQMMELGYTLAPGHEREFRVYKGLKLTGRSYTKAQLYIRLPNGDYFCADFEILYAVRPDGESEVKELRLIHPVHDI